MPAEINMGIEQDIKQKKFNSEKEKALVNILYTHHWLKEQQGFIWKNYGLSTQQFNILRILRGQHPNPASVKLLTERMLDKMSNASRLVDKLLEKGLVERHYCKSDRRQVDVLITDLGLKTINDASKESTEHISTFNITESEASTLSTLLDKMRS